MASHLLLLPWWATTEQTCLITRTLIITSTTGPKQTLFLRHLAHRHLRLSDGALFKHSLEMMPSTRGPTAETASQQSSLPSCMCPSQCGFTVNYKDCEKIVGLSGNYRHAPLLALLTIYTPCPEKMQQDSLEPRVTQRSGHAFTPSFWISIIFQLRDMINRSSSYKHLTGHPEVTEPALENRKVFLQVWGAMLRNQTAGLWAHESHQPSEPLALINVFNSYAE